MVGEWGLGGITERYNLDGWMDAWEWDGDGGKSGLATLMFMHRL